MFSNLKYLFLYLYEATERMEEKSAEIAENHRQRMEAFRKERDEMAEKAKAKMDEARRQAKETFSAQARDIVGDLGLATKDELDEIKKSLSSITRKLDKLSKK